METTLGTSVEIETMLFWATRDQPEWLIKAIVATKVRVDNASFTGPQQEGTFEFTSITAALQYVEQAMNGLRDSFPPHDREELEQSMRLDEIDGHPVLHWHGGRIGLSTTFFIALKSD